MEEIMEEVMKETMEEVNCQAGGEGIAVVNAVGGDFAVHRRLLLAVAMEVGERGGGEDFTAGNAAGGGVGRATVGGEAGGAVGGGGVCRATAAGGGAGGAVGVGKGQSMMIFFIIVFNSSSCWGVKSEVMTLT